MPSILVVEQELGTVQRIRDVLSASGMRVRFTSGPQEALDAAAADPPDLVLLSSDAPGAEAIARKFSRRAGGPGVVAMLSGSPAARMFATEADDQIAKPLGDQALRQVVEQALAARAAAAPPKKVLRSDVKLTSQDIFGDVLAEVESAMPGGPMPSRPPVAPRAAPPASPAGDEINRKLEKTLSGVLGPEFLSRPTPNPARKPDLPSEDVDALISKTLSNLDLGARSRPAAPPPSNAPLQAPGVEASGVRRVPTRTDLDLAQLEDLARVRRRPDPPPPPAASAPPPTVPSPAPPRAEPPPTRLASPPPAPVPAPAPPAAAPPVAVPLATQRIDMASVLFDDENDAGERFGQYRLLEKIAVGGMAEVWKARMRGVQGFQKTVAIKKILPHMTDNSDFIEMFIDEAKLAAQLSHPNIVHIYDLGKIGRDYYIAMEYVEGKDLRSLLNMSARNGQPVPMALALWIAARLASALHYAHRKRDFEGRELGLVHRDVSPQNVLLTLDGDVKLCDFGVAKAVSKVSQTQVGALKGKLQYMSPEQAWGKPVDFRSDIFSLGVILFELLTGQRLFPGDSEMSILEAVRQNRIRSPRDVNPALPYEVDELVNQALATRPEVRFASAGEMEQRIEGLLHELRLTPGAAELSSYLDQVVNGQPLESGAPVPTTPFSPPPAAEPEAPAGVKEEDLPPGAASWPSPTAASPALATPAVPPAFQPPLPAAPVVAAAPPEPAPQITSTIVSPIEPVGDLPFEEPRRGRGRWIVILLILALLALVAAYFLFIKPRPDAARQPTAAPPPAAAPASPAAESSSVPATAQSAAPASSGSTAEPRDAAGLPKDVQGLVDRELAKREDEMRRQFEEKKRQLEKEIQRSKAKPAKPPADA
jgi:serine/threonine protein kinase/CheY-like chemotaxis protein